MCRFDRADDVGNRRRQFAGSLEIRVESRKLPLVWQFAVKQKPGRLLKARMFGEIVDRVAAVTQFPGLAINEGAGGPIKVNAFKTALNLDRLGGFGH